MRLPASPFKFLLQLKPTEFNLLKLNYNIILPRAFFFPRTEKRVGEQWTSIVWLFERRGEERGAGRGRVPSSFLSPTRRAVLVLAPLLISAGSQRSSLCCRLIIFLFSCCFRLSFFPHPRFSLFLQPHNTTPTWRLEGKQYTAQFGLKTFIHFLSASGLQSAADRVHS